MGNLIGFIAGIAVLGLMLWAATALASWGIAVIGLPATIVVACLLLK